MFVTFVLYTTVSETCSTYNIATPSKHTSVTDLSTTTISVSNTSEPICIRQKSATRREPNGIGEFVVSSVVTRANINDTLLYYTKMRNKKRKLTSSVVKVI